jgi:HEAT repeat protein
MKRWAVVTLLVGAVAGVAAYFLVPEFFPPLETDPGANVQVAPKQTDQIDKAAAIVGEVQQLFQDYHGSKEGKPSVATRKVVGKLAALGAPVKETVPVLAAWLKRMNDAGHGNSPEFREFALALLAVDPDSPRLVVLEYRRAKYKADIDCCAHKLVAFGKASLPAVLDGLHDEVGDPSRAGMESWSKLPWVLARLGPDALAVSRTALTHELPAMRRQALRALVLMGPELAAEALGDVTLLLKDKDAKVRYLAALALGELNAKNPPPEALVETLKDTDPVVRLAAAHGLSRHPQFDTARLIPVLVALLKDNAFTRSAWDVEKSRQDSLYTWRSLTCPYFQVFWEETTADLLIELGPKGQPTAEAVVDLLKSCDHDGRHLIHLLMVQGDGGKAAVPGLAKMLKHPAPQQRYKALLALGRLGFAVVVDALANIRAAMDDPDPRVRWRAFLTLAELDPEEAQQRLPSSLSAVVASARLQLHEPHLAQGRIRTRSVWQYSDITLQPHWEVPDSNRETYALWTLSDEELTVEENRSKAILKDLERVALLEKEVAPFLVAAWYGTTDHPKLRVNQSPITLKLLAALGSDAEAAVPDLVRGLGWYDTAQIANVLVKIGDAALPALAQVLGDPAATDRHVPALKVLQEFGPKAKPAVPALVKALRLENEVTRMVAAETFASLDEAGGAAVGELKKMLGETDNDVRRHAADALGHLGPTAKDAVPDLIALFKHDNAQLRLVAGRALGRIGKDAVEPLRKALADPDDRVRLGAILALGRMGDAATAALPEIRKLAESDPQMPVREAARELQMRLDGEKKGG